MTRRNRPPNEAQQALIDALTLARAFDEPSAQTLGNVGQGAAQNAANRLYARGWLARSGPRWWLTAEARQALLASPVHGGGGPPAAERAVEGASPEAQTP